MIGARVYRTIRRSSGRTSSTWLMKKIIFSLMAIGATSCLTITGTFALMSSQQTNAHSAIATGTLTFNNVVNNGTACFSYTGAGASGNANGSCQALFSGASLNYPGVPAVATVKLTNDGSLDASDLSVYMPSCTVVATTGAPTPGGGNPCASGGAQFYIQETDASGANVACRFPSGSTNCSFLANSLSTFAANGNSVANALDLGAGPAHGQSRYFSIGVQLPATASNTLQGEEALFGLTWHLTA